MPKSGYSVSTYLRERQKASSASVSLLSSKSEWAEKPPIKVSFVRRMFTGRKSINRIREFRTGYKSFLEIHNVLKDKPVGSKYMLSRKSRTGTTRSYVYEKVSADEYKLVSKVTTGGRK